jgi:hypothetical protein
MRRAAPQLERQADQHGQRVGTGGGEGHQPEPGRRGALVRVRQLAEPDEQRSHLCNHLEQPARRAEDVAAVVVRRRPGQRRELRRVQPVDRGAQPVALPALRLRGYGPARRDSARVLVLPVILALQVAAQVALFPHRYCSRLEEVGKERLGFFC